MLLERSAPEHPKGEQRHLELESFSIDRILLLDKLLKLT